MKLFLCHQSALEYWRKKRKLPGSSADRRCRVVLPEAQMDIEPCVISMLDLPVHVMIGNPDIRRVSVIAKQHVFSGETPVGCFMNTGGGLMVSSPEFCLLQMAEQLSLISLIELGYELCGAYSIPHPNDANVPIRGFYKRQALTSVNKLKTYLESMPGIKGHQKLFRSLRYILVGSASPMETKLAMFLTLPYMLGGYGFDLPELNKRIDLPKTARREFNKDFYVCDIFWPKEKIAVEYDSDQQHTGSDRIARDSKRRNVLDSLGIRVTSVTKQQLYSNVELDRVAKVISKHMNKRLFPSKNNFAVANRELRKQLL